MEHNEFLPEVIHEDKQQAIFTQLVQRMMLSVAMARQARRDTDQALLEEERAMDELQNAF